MHLPWFLKGKNLDILENIWNALKNKSIPYSWCSIRNYYNV